MKYWIQLNYNLQDLQVFYLWWIRPDSQNTVNNFLPHH
jgi:hypothetical protein